MNKQPSKSVELAWTRLLRASSVALSSVEASLKAANLPPLAWYDVLLELEREGRRGLRPFELQQRLLLPQYQLSRLLDRIEAKQYIRRFAIAEDGRGQRMVITGAGIQNRKAMWDVYGPAMQAVVGERLNAGETAKLAKLLDKLITGES